jgi:glycosyltransferase involved in cell wall biosynthesis
MRILHVIATLDAASGGSATACIEMADALARRGHQVDIMTTDFGYAGRSVLPRRSQPLTCRVLTYPVAFPRSWKRSPVLAQALTQNIGTYDLVVIHSLHLFHNMVATTAAIRARIPYVVAPHGLLDPFILRRSRLKKTIMEMAFQSRSLSCAAAIHYTSDEEMRISQASAQGAPGFIIPLGVSPPSSLSATRDFTRVLFLSRLHPKKGLDLLIPAFARVKQRMPHAELVIAGPDDGALQTTQALVAQHGLSDSVSFPGMLQGIDKDRALAEAGVFVLPSYSENFGIALAEAMAAGLPVITTDKVNIHDAVRAADAGLVVPCDVDFLSEALLRLLGDRELASRMGQNGRLLATTRYDWDQIGAQWEATCRRLIAEHRVNG